MNRQDQDEQLVRELFPEHPEYGLPVLGQPESLAEVEPSGSPAPLDVISGPPPADDAKVPTTVPEVNPAPSTASIVRPHKSTPFTPDEIQIALHLRDKELSLREIATRLDRSVEGVRQVLIEWTPTQELAKAILKRNASKFADKIVDQADVDQSMEVLDRLDVLPKRERDTGGNKVQVVIGMNIDDVVPKVLVTEVPNE